MQYGIVLTGGIATGKSTVAALMKLFGFRIIDADLIAHKKLQESAEEIVKLFGKEFVKEGVVDRKALGALIFSNQNERKKLETLLHPKIKEEIFLQAKKQEAFKKPYLIDIPLYFEKEQAYKDFTKTLVVYAPKELQLERLMKRDNLNKEEALLRIDAQLPIEFKKQKATFLIENIYDLKHLQNECERVKGEILSCM